jgi:hypothetical protein
MDRLLEQPGPRPFISRLSIVEMESVLAIKVRTAEKQIGQITVIVAADQKLCRVASLGRLFRGKF